MNRIFIFLTIIAFFAATGCDLKFDNPADPASAAFGNLYIVANPSEIRTYEPKNNANGWRNLVSYKVLNADLYHFQVSTSNSSFDGNIIFEKADSADCKAFVDPAVSLVKDAVYYWRVRARDSASGLWGPWSGISAYKANRVRWAISGGSYSAVDSNGNIYFRTSGGALDKYNPFGVRKASAYIGYQKWQMVISPNNAIPVAGLTANEQCILSWYTPGLAILHSSLQGMVSDDDTVYLSAASDNSIYLVLSTNLGHNGAGFYKFDQAGNSLWSISTPQAEASAPVIGTDGVMYIYSSFYSTGIYGYTIKAVNADGSVKWNISTPGGAYTPCAIGSDFVLMYRFDKLTAYTMAGTVKWTYPNTIRSQGVIGSDNVVYAMVLNGIAAVNPADGTQKWYVNLSTASNKAPIIGDNGRVYAFSDTTLYVLNSSTGAVLGSDSITTGILYDNPCMDKSGVIYIFDYSDGVNQLFAVESESSSYDTSARWPMFGHDPQRSGQAQ
jgi:hypothetical protein